MIIESHTLSPAQQGMLFQTLVSPGTGAYLNQMIFDFPQELHPATFWRAWEQVVEYHPILRSSVRWVGLEEPVLDVHDHVNLPIVERDLRDLPDQKQKEFIESYLHEDRCLGVDLNSAPTHALYFVSPAGCTFLLYPYLPSYYFRWSFNGSIVSPSVRSLPVLSKGTTPATSSQQTVPCLCGLACATGFFKGGALLEGKVEGICKPYSRKSSLLVWLPAIMVNL